MNKIWGFLRETTELAKKAGIDKDTGLIRTGLDEYLKIIFPETKDLLHDKAFGEYNGQKYKIRPDYRSESLKLIIEFDGLPHYKNPAVIEKDYINQKIYEDNMYKVVIIRYFIQLSKEVVEKLFGVKVPDLLFDATIPSCCNSNTNGNCRSFYKKFFLSRSMRKTEIFKQIRKEYLENKIIGYYYFQSFLGGVPKNQVDFILNSEEAYSILKVIKNSNGKYTFDGKKFKSKINKLQHVFASTGYFISSLVLMFYLLFYGEIQAYMSLKLYILFFIFLSAIFMPILISSIIHISEIRNVQQLEKITQKRKRCT
ncbi:hypothetical protein [Treponema pectinovorum]|uniref:hypothetical protein n=1 Tax=Treponema pectinovorum TaxID=164 RepID=UPI003D8F360F